MQVAYNIKLIIALISIVHLELRVAGLRILGGRNALKDEFPFVVRLEFQATESIDGKTHFVYHPFCTGAAISRSWILTAAHCHDDAVIKLVILDFITSKLPKFARYNSYFPKELGQLSPITKIIAHPSFSFSLFDRKIRSKNDIALYQTVNISVSQYVRLSAIDYKAFIGHEALVLGFGRTNATPSTYPLQVLKGMLRKCDAREGQLYGILCVAPRCGQGGTICGGDSGGPVVHSSGIVGVNSLIYAGCSEHELNPGYAAVGVTMVSPVTDWISNIIDINSEG